MTEQVTIQKPEAQDDPAHIEAMVAKVDGTPAPEEKPTDPPADNAGDAERPAWLPEKFKSAEDMAKAYAELEAKQGGKQEEKPEDAPKDKPEGDQASADEAAKELANKGLNLDDFSNEFSQTGALSDASYEKLEKAGYPRSLVDQYIDGQKALAANYEADVKSAAGGAEKFDVIAAWAADNLTEAEKVAFNKAVDSRDPAQAKLAVSGLAQKYAVANPSEGNLLGGRAAGVGDVYESLAQVTKDMASPEYKSDPAFRKKVQEKIGRSNVM